MANNDQAPRTMVFRSTPLGRSDGSTRHQQQRSPTVRNIAANGRPALPYTNRAIFLDEVDSYPQSKIGIR